MKSLINGTFEIAYLGPQVVGLGEKENLTILEFRGLPHCPKKMVSGHKMIQEKL